jgi:branched-subunit amino acid ABC-type transport system permease component
VVFTGSAYVVIAARLYIIFGLIEVVGFACGSPLMLTASMDKRRSSASDKSQGIT